MCPSRMPDGQRTLLNLLKPWMMEPGATVIIPFDDRVVLISLLNRAEFSRRPSKVAQTLDAISGIQFLVGDRRVGKWRLLGTV